MNLRTTQGAQQFMRQHGHQVKQSISASLPLALARGEDIPQWAWREPGKWTVYQLCRERWPGEVQTGVRDVIPNRRFELEIFFPAEKLNVEVDGWQHHGKYQQAWKNDHVRIALLQDEADIFTIRFANFQCLFEPKKVVDRIARWRAALR